MKKNDPNPDQMMIGMHLLQRTRDNFEWWLNSYHSKSLSRESYKLLISIYELLDNGIRHFYPFKRPALFQHADWYLEGLMQADPVAQAVDLRIIFNLPEGEMLKEAYVIKAAPYNITYHGKRSK